VAGLGTGLNASPAPARGGRRARGPPQGADPPGATACGGRLGRV